MQAGEVMELPDDKHNTRESESKGRLISPGRVNSSITLSEGEDYEDITLYLRASNLWRSWTVKLKNLQEEKENSIWKGVSSQLETIPEISHFIKDPQTRYYSNALDSLSTSFSRTQLLEIFRLHKARKGESPIPTLLLVPKEYHISQIDAVHERPLSVLLQIEGEHPSLWLLHKTNVREEDSYFDQLKIDIEKAHQICGYLQQPLDLIPSIQSRVTYKFFTSSSTERDSLCQEIPVEYLDQYLRQGNQKWVIRTVSSVEAEIALKRKQFSSWEPQPQSSKLSQLQVPQVAQSPQSPQPIIQEKECEGKILVEESDAKNLGTKEVLGLDTLDTKEKTDSNQNQNPKTWKSNREIYAAARRYGTNLPQLRIPPGSFLRPPQKQTKDASTLPTTTLSVKSSQDEEVKSEITPVSVPISKNPFQKALDKVRTSLNTKAPNWMKEIGAQVDANLNRKADGTTEPANSNGVLYFCLAIITAVVLGLIVVTVVCVTQKKKKKLALQREQEFLQPNPSRPSTYLKSPPPSPTAQTANIHPASYTPNPPTPSYTTTTPAASYTTTNSSPAAAYLPTTSYPVNPPPTTSYLPYSSGFNVNTVAEPEEQDLKRLSPVSIVTPRKEISSIPDHYDLSPLPGGSDFDDDTEAGSVEETLDEQTERELIDQKIGQENPHFGQAQRAEYTHEDMEEDSRIYEFYDKYSQDSLQRDLDHTLSFPTSSKICPDGSCNLNRNQNMKISF